MPHEVSIGHRLLLGTFLCGPLICICLSIVVQIRWARFFLDSFGWMMVFSLLISLWSLLCLAWCVKMTLQTFKDYEQRVRWMVLLVVGNALMFPVFWYGIVWRQKQRIEKKHY